MEKDGKDCLSSSEHDCHEHRVYDGGRKVNRDGVRVWIETYYCSICKKILDITEEILD